MLEKRRIATIIILNLVITSILLTIAFAAPVYTEGESYRIEVLEDGQMQVRKATRVYKDGVAISPPTYHRHVLSPGADVTKEVKRVKDISEAVWTDAVVEKYKDKQDKIKPIEVIAEEPEDAVLPYEILEIGE